MEAYIYQAALLCDDCGRDRRRQLGPQPFDPEDERAYDSGDYPKGPYPDGGGEADCPNHCDCCGVFLENPLTTDGVAYVLDALESGDGDPDVLAEWREFYADAYDLDAALSEIPA